MRKFFVFAFILVLLAAAAAAGFIWYSTRLPYAGFTGETFVEVPKGAGPRTIAYNLAQAGVIKSEWDFLIVRAIRRKPVLQAGEYRFTEPLSAWDAFDKIARGDVFYYELTIPEGANMFDIGAAVERLGVIQAKEFLAVARNPESIRDLAPDAPSLEGYLFPAGYRLTRRTTAQQLAAEMTNRFRRAWKDMAGEVPSGMNVNVNDVVTLASLVEKETGIASERPLVAAVFHNRLKHGMRLQCDPTTIYAALLDDRYRGTIYRSDLDSTSPYNTYQHAGLPPGPIANPGSASMKAAIQPAKAEYLYFVAKADGSGEHIFSTELAQHNAAVEEYRRGTQESVEAGSGNGAPRRAPVQSPR
jgi:UPF0755 protein